MPSATSAAQHRLERLGWEPHTPSMHHQFQFPSQPSPTHTHTNARTHTHSNLPSARDFQAAGKAPEGRRNSVRPSALLPSLLTPLLIPGVCGLLLTVSQSDYANETEAAQDPQTMRVLPSGALSGNWKSNHPWANRKGKHLP